mmetsp:Transcript_112003/g.316604  ORF Transcript_112003/g.316604 Transcript_112003/m.316604 type:complete len:244 (-) Transcript_112003:645-1376(-)
MGASSAPEAHSSLSCGFLSNCWHSGSRAKMLGAVGDAKGSDNVVSPVASLEAVAVDSAAVAVKLPLASSAPTRRRRDPSAPFPKALPPPADGRGFAGSSSSAGSATRAPHKCWPHSTMVSEVISKTSGWLPETLRSTCKAPRSTEWPSLSMSDSTAKIADSARTALIGTWSCGESCIRANRPSTATASAARCALVMSTTSTALREARWSTFVAVCSKKWKRNGTAATFMTVRSAPLCCNWCTA